MNLDTVKRYLTRAKNIAALDPTSIQFVTLKNRLEDNIWGLERAEADDLRFYLRSDVATVFGINEITVPQILFAMLDAN